MDYKVSIGVPLEALPALSWCAEVSLGGTLIITSTAMELTQTSG